MPSSRKPIKKRPSSTPTQRQKARNRGAPLRRRHTPNRDKRRFNWLVMEMTGIGISITLLTMALLGEAARRFSGLTFWNHLLPFAMGAGGLVIVVAGALVLWLRCRRRLADQIAVAPAVLAMTFALIAGWLALHQGYTAVFGQFKSLVGGKAQAERMTLEHQVYAAYRRQDMQQLTTLIQRESAFDAAITEAARAFDIDKHLLQGVAATESSFLPRESRDGGHGLFQITAVPNAIVREASTAMGKPQPNLLEPRDNAYIAAATLRHYLAEMRGDLFLGLLAYNIGPKNGGLRFIMDQYGAHDFVTMQPYLQQLPRDYPIRVLSYALAFKIWHHNHGRLLAYEEGNNAVKIQRLGIPGMIPVF